MRLTQDNLDELNLLAHFKLGSTQEGIKVHHTADDGIIKAAERLHDKGLITQPDGGYLTTLGRDASEHLDAALTILKIR